MFKKKRFCIQFFIILCLSLAWQQQGNSQSIFRAGGFIGSNFAQINNDSYAGYNKVGLHGGIKVITRLSSKIDMHTELIYSQRGSYTSKLPTRDGPEVRDISLNYIDIPLLFSIKDWLVESKSGKKYYITHLMGGVSYGRLINKSTDGFKPSKISGLPLDDYLKSNDLSLVAGVTFFLSPSIGLHGRISYSLSNLTDDLSEEFNEVLGKLKSYLLTVRLSYYIN